MKSLWRDALIDSLRHAPLLVGHLPEAVQFDRKRLGVAGKELRLNARQKLGHLYESALEELLLRSERVDLLASSLQIVEQSGRTVGEMDYLLYDKVDGDAVQLELSVKFYLAHHSVSGWRYPGPDPKDNWHGKLERMRTHQLRLSQFTETQSILRKRFGVEALSVRQLIYGRLFLPFEREDCPMPDKLSQEALIGRWLFIRQRAEFLPTLDEVYLLPKALWPVQVNEALLETLPVVSVTELERLAQERCVMFIPPGKLQPIFLVPDRWPSSGL